MATERIVKIPAGPPSHVGNNPPASGMFLGPAVSPALTRGFWLATACLVLAFIWPLLQWTVYAAGSQLYSYILLIPFVSFYFIWLKRKTLEAQDRPARGLAAVLMAAGSLVLLAYWMRFRPQIKAMEDDYLAVMALAFLLFFWGICNWFWGRKFVYASAFPLAFLIFVVPIPLVAVGAIETFLQHGSAIFARMFFVLAGTPLLQDGLVFQLPGITLKIAPECSGIHSSVVLLITSLVASYCFLRTPWKRAVFVLFVIPLGLIRNGFRVFVIGELCVHIGPHMIDSPIHHRGGPLFFALSLIPLFLLLILLYRSEKTRGGAQTSTHLTPSPKATE